MNAQLDRLRLNNTQLLSQRDFARQEANEFEMNVLRVKESGDAVQQALEHEVFRLTTITDQQGKLIKHMRSLIPAEFARTSESDVITGKTQPKFVKMHTRGGGGGPLVSAASAFFTKRRKPDTKTNV